MDEKKSADPAATEKAKLYRSLNALVMLAVLGAFIYGVFGYDFKTCRPCSGIGKFVVSCKWCDGDGRVSLWKSFRQDNGVR